MLSSVLNEGARGLQLSQREIQKSANEIARVNVREEEPNVPESDPSSAIQAISQPEQTGQRGVEEPLIELRRQEQLFTASAQVISVADKTLGTLIDVKS